MQKRNEHIYRLEKLLDYIVRSSNLHVKWLNTLSYLEHLGAKKIHKTNFGTNVTEMILSHACEEARHAYFYKKSIRKIQPDIDINFNYEYQNLLAGFSSYRYFQTLDLEVWKRIRLQHKKREVPFFCYLYVTYIIEERADLVFKIYEERLKENQIPLTIQSVIREEEKHLNEIFHLLEQYDEHYESNLKILSDLESNLFDRLLARLEKVVFHSR